MKDISRLYIAVAAPIIIGLSSCSLTRQIEVVGAGHDIAYRTQIETSQEIPKKVQESIYSAQDLSDRIKNTTLPIKKYEYDPRMTQYLKLPELKFPAPYNIILNDSAFDLLKYAPKKIDLKFEKSPYLR